MAKHSTEPVLADAAGDLPRTDPLRHAVHIALLVLLSPALLLVLVFGGILVLVGYVQHFFAIAWNRGDRVLRAPAEPIVTPPRVGSSPVR